MYKGINDSQNKIVDQQGKKSQTSKTKLENLTLRVTEEDKSLRHVLNEITRCHPKFKIIFILSLVFLNISRYIVVHKSIFFSYWDSFNFKIVEKKVNQIFQAFLIKLRFPFSLFL